MKRASNHAATLAYLGVVLVVIGMSPDIPIWQNSNLFHGLLHVLIFAGAALFFYGLETLRRFAGRHRRMVH